MQSVCADNPFQTTIMYYGARCLLLLVLLLLIGPARSEDNELYTCTLTVAVPSGRATFAVRPRDPFVVKFLAALRFTRQNGLNHGSGCDTAECVAKHILGEVDQGLCAQLLRHNAVFVSVGESCNVAIALRDLGARSAAFPFDWNLKPLDSVVAMLRSNFSSPFLRPESMRVANVRLPKNALESDGFKDGIPRNITMAVPTIDDAASILLPHDFIAASDDIDAGVDDRNLASARAKYERRIQRLQRLLAQDATHVFLVTERADYQNWPSASWNPFVRLELAFEHFGVDPATWFNHKRFERARNALVDLFARRPNVHVVTHEEASDLLTEVSALEDREVSETGGFGFPLN